MKASFTPAMLTGKSREHLSPLPCPFSTQHFLQPDALKAFQGLQQSAVKNGFNLQPVSSFRDFQRQQMIWNEKFAGKRKVHNDEGQALDLSCCSDWEKCQAILRWSALPGGSRHHWGTEVDIFDPDLLPADQKLQLEPWEYGEKGYFFELSEWLKENVQKFDFYFPFSQMPERLKIGIEPWHLSYFPVAEQAQQTFTSEVLLQSWQDEEIEGKPVLTAQLTQIFNHFFI
ncbi:M15 family metallopeptidase [Avibacterium paragallinarum]|uniref:Putative D-alanyl-D-alanine carboxypeptidase n=1 Tax=Avibacterium paragallinarum TaxID=728 RepID=A0A377I6W5_AVIPA|nr:M15 family metallopeptidase [Avibacterium paragallinarum]POY46431.1 peptidase M15 [Avibacterium paragallinarum]RZN75068.1 D-alanyl-D-alanine carboxypeptidase family protein [Avibacterium paragallinarum]CDF99224.1 Putative D,D-carboxypeptidase family protein [Avibacterium paragallinarum JF4211]STO71036.1 putative D-alanyl-D-alanine carboxypeptidase [Avibacterium paragallinarum]